MSLHAFSVVWLRSAALLLFGLLSACTVEQDTFLDITFDPCAVVVAPDADVRPEEIESIDAALQMWNAVGGFRLSRTGPAEWPRLPVRFESAAGPFRGLYDDEQGKVYINRELRRDAKAVAMAHELGHAFGMWHVNPDEARSVMHPGNVEVPPTAWDVAEVQKLWAPCDGRAHDRAPADGGIVPAPGDASMYRTAPR